jgi:NAD(P) transhydrogenase subunit alpha
LYARNVFDFLKLILTRHGALHVPMDDDIVAACLVARPVVAPVAADDALSTA